MQLLDLPSSILDSYPEYNILKMNMCTDKRGSDQYIFLHKRATNNRMLLNLVGNYDFLYLEGSTDMIFQWNGTPQANAR